VEGGRSNYLWCGRLLIIAGLAWLVEGPCGPRLLLRKLHPDERPRSQDSSGIWVGPVDSALGPALPAYDLDTVVPHPPRPVLYTTALMANYQLPLRLNEAEASVELVFAEPRNDGEVPRRPVGTHRCGDEGVIVGGGLRPERQEVCHHILDVPDQVGKVAKGEDGIDGEAVFQWWHVNDHSRTKGIDITH
jgi:hypothetical protein